VIKTARKQSSKKSIGSDETKHSKMRLFGIALVENSPKYFCPSNKINFLKNFK